MNTVWRRIFKFALALLLLMVIVGGCLHQPRPTLQPGQAADALAQRVMTAVGDRSWRALQRVVFDFRGQLYDWNVQGQSVWVGHTPGRILIDLATGDCRSEDASSSVAASMCRYRKARWNNDSFWLHPFGKFFDAGAERSLCSVEDEQPPWLCIRFGSGGNTPGDLYAIEVGPDGRPTAWRMWVKIIPVGGTHTRWSQWRQLPGGAWFADVRELGLYTIPIKVLRVEL